MKWIVCLLAFAVAGCASPGPEDGPTDEVEDAPCAWAGSQTLYLGPLWSLGADLPDAGRTPGNGFDEAFLTNALDEWTSVPLDRSIALVGSMNLTFWTQGNNMPAPIVLGGDPGQGYHFFNQFGTNRGFIESYAVEYAGALGDTEVRQYVQTFTMPVGGLILEKGDHLRLLLTNLVLDEAQSGRGPDILWGGDTPSRIEFTAKCVDLPTWKETARTAQSVSIPAHRGLLTGAIPAEEGVNFADVTFELKDTTGRLEIQMLETGRVNPTKNDMDITVHDASGAQVWSIGSPYTDEVGTKYRTNMDTMPPGTFTVRVDSYSGMAYEGQVIITQWTGA